MYVCSHMYVGIGMGIGNVVYAYIVCTQDSGVPTLQE